MGAQPASPASMGIFIGMDGPSKYGYGGDIYGIFLESLTSGRPGARNTRHYPAGPPFD